MESAPNNDGEFIVYINLKEVKKAAGRLDKQTLRRALLFISKV